MASIERAGRAISGSIDRYFRISDIEFDKSSCSGKSPKRFAYKHLIDASLTMLNCKMDDDASEKDIKRLRGMWALFTSLSVWSENDLKTSQQLRESTIVPHAVFISAFALASKRIREDGVEFESLVEVFDNALDYSREADCWEGLCIIDGKLTKNSKTVSATAEYIYSQISDSKEYQKLLGGKA
ncbi:hypothetical protein MHM93_14525 [Pseudoalteromonas sp. MM17-2]|uniref:DNA sulfur modification protein DndB n=1 Tax=Pseudoalteromonas sp. MM17-2 TaxID=2917753 RepID=UPI001EF6DEB0|nr:DNA sulfur modification protein DndB [Pseudoalteromonas sp. MM17-2]MCG7545393.1 hypothetical protein [Pseudoalteromonas sp. MM17-2]